MPFLATLELGPEARAFTRGEDRPSVPVRARWKMGRAQPSDIVWTDHATAVLVSERVLALCREHAFSGWTTYPVALSGKDGAPLPGFHGLAVHGRCGPIDNSLSVATPKQFPARVSTVWMGLYFDTATWDGSDLFMAAGGWGYIFVTRAVKDVLVEARIKDVDFTPLDEVERRML